MKLTKTDLEAVKRGDSNYLNSKGANAYVNEDYKTAAEYYHLASTMGNVNAICNLGYCYLYGRHDEANLNLAIAYFEAASTRNNIEAMYKLGDIYGSDKWGVKDEEMSIYYYRNAASFIIREDWGEYTIAYEDELNKYPSLCFALGRELMPAGHMNTDIECAYQFLKHAESGYKREVANGAHFYEKPLNNVKELLDEEIFDEYEEKYRDIFDEGEIVDIDEE
ncbi:MAG: hypothetical protein Q4B60_09740 [Erysipelotrichaceae bacterium]|nr:hypothetical protein [Erysipelotrichaceae bacterium]